MRFSHAVFCAALIAPAVAAAQTATPPASSQQLPAPQTALADADRIGEIDFGGRVSTGGGRRRAVSAVPRSDAAVRR